MGTFTFDHLFQCASSLSELFTEILQSGRKRLDGPRHFCCVSFVSFHFGKSESRSKTPCRPIAASTRIRVAEIPDAPVDTVPTGILQEACRGWDAFEPVPATFTGSTPTKKSERKVASHDEVIRKSSKHKNWRISECVLFQNALAYLQ